MYTLYVEVYPGSGRPSQMRICEGDMPRMAEFNGGVVVGTYNTYEEAEADSAAQAEALFERDGDGYLQWK